MPDGAVIIAAITSCTNTSNPRNVIAAGLLARNANARGLTRKPWVKSSLAPGSKAVQLYLEEAKLLTELEQLGFGIVAFACTTCNGMSGALDPQIQQEIIDRDLYATAVLSGNRNFDGRIHPYAKQAFLASPPLVVAYAIAGTVRFDIEKDVLGTDADGRPVTLKDIWPNDAEIDAVDREEREARALPQGVRPDVHGQRGLGRENQPAVRLASAEHVHPPAAVLGRAPWQASARSRACVRSRCSATTSRPTTCRRRTRSCWTAPRANTSRRWGCPKRTSIPTRRIAATISPRSARRSRTPRSSTRWRVVDGKVRKGSLARIEPDGKVVRMWEAIETYMDRKQPLIIVAGADYGQGSSRDWAAKGVRLAGVEAIVAEGFERIHRTNLIGMGVLPLEFKRGRQSHDARHRRHRDLST